MIGGDSGHGLKPDPGPLLAALREMSSDAGKAVMIGDTAKALSVIEAAGKDNLFLQYDLYHGAINGEDLLAAVRDNLGRRVFSQKKNEGASISATFVFYQS